MKPSLLDFLKLTKPTINLLVVITGATALMMEGSMMSKPFDFVLILTALFFTAGSANALNQYFERDIDAQMPRTKKKRPLPDGRMSPRAALVFAIASGVFGVAVFAVRYNLLSAGLSLATILFYSFFYTLWLKPRTYLNIVIGGAAGAMAPVIAWAAVTGGLDLAPAILFLIIFFWTPPHFWALAYVLRDEYKAVNYPMLPVVKGEEETLRQIWVYTLILVATTLALPLVGVGIVGLVFSVALGIYFIRFAMQFRNTGERKEGWKLFAYSIVYLLVLFVGIMVDAAWNVRPWN